MLLRSRVGSDVDVAKEAEEGGPEDTIKVVSTSQTPEEEENKTYNKIHSQANRNGWKDMVYVAA